MVKPLKEWLVDLDHKNFTPELVELLHNMFERLAWLNVRSLRHKLTRKEEYERLALRQFHEDVRYGRGVWAPYIAKSKKHHIPRRER